MVSSEELIIGVLAGAVGAGYFVYGRRTQMAVPMISGVLLGVYPYFTDDIWILAGVGIVLIALPFFLRF
jgi:hypothetical protein